MTENDREEIYQNARIEINKINRDILLDNFRCLLLIIMSIIVIIGFVVYVYHYFPWPIWVVLGISAIIAYPLSKKMTHR